MRTLAKLTGTELRLFAREPLAGFFTLLFPTLLVVILGSVKAFRVPQDSLGGQRVIDVYVTISATFVLATLALQGLPAVLATYRERGVLRRLSTTPVPASRLLAAQLVMNTLIALTSVALVLIVAGVVFGTPAPHQAVGYALALVGSAGALFAVGLFVASVAPSGRAAGAIGTLLFFPVMFFAGLWAPREVMPPLLRTIGDLTPLGAGEHALHDAAIGAWPHPAQFAVLLAYLVAFGLASAKLFRWE